MKRRSKLTTTEWPWVTVEDSPDSDVVVSERVMYERPGEALGSVGANIKLWWLFAGSFVAFALLVPRGHELAEA